MTSPINADREPFPRWLPYAAAAVAGIVVWSGLPLGVPGEWTWSGRPIGFLFSPSMLIAGLAVTAYLGASFGVSQLVQRERLATGWAAALVGVLATGLLLAFQASIPGVSGLMRSPFVLFDFRATGYFTESRPQQDDLPGFLRGYEATVAEGDYLHQGTHPPGLITGYILLGRLVQQVPAVRQFSEAIRSPEAVDTFEVLATYPTAPTPDEAAVLHLFGLLTTAAAAAAVVPLAILIARIQPSDAAVRLASLWPLVPAVAIFLPKSDALLPVIPLSIAVLYVAALERTDRTRLLYAVAAGLAAGLGLLISLAVLPIYAAIALAPLSPRRLRTDWPVIAAGAAGVAAWIVVFAGIGTNLPAIWLHNVQNHAAFYDHNVRTTWLWGLVNPVEGAIAASLPMVAVATWQFATVSDRRSLRHPVGRLVVGVAAAWVVLWLSGKNQGEAGRLWLLLMPWPIVAIAVSGSTLSKRRWWHLAVAVSIAAVLVVVRIDGFGLLDQLQPTAAG